MAAGDHLYLHRTPGQLHRTRGRDFLVRWVRTSALVLNQHVTNRTPLLIRGLVPHQVTSEVANWVNTQHNGTVKIRVVPSSQFDGRHTNLQPVYGGNPNDTSRMVHASTTSLLQYILGHTEAPCDCPGGEPCDWRELRAYWRVIASELAENSPDEGSRQLLRQVDAAANPFDNGLIEGNWQRTAVLTRAGSAGLYYPAHIDCAPNMLQVFAGRRLLHLLDMKEATRRRPEQVSELLQIKRVLADGHKYGDVYRAELRAGDMLYIPCLWLHDVMYPEGSVGANSFYASPQHADEHLCDFLKGHYFAATDVNKTERLRMAINLSESRDPPKQFSEYFKPLGLREPGNSMQRLRWWVGVLWVVVLTLGVGVVGVCVWNGNQLAPPGPQIQRVDSQAPNVPPSGKERGNIRVRAFPPRHKNTKQ